MSWGDHPYSTIQVKNTVFCSNSCRDDCNCWAALYENTSHNCKKYRLPLRYGKRNQNISAIAYFKVDSNSDFLDTDNHAKIPIDEKNSLILVLVSSFVSVLCLLFLVAVVSFLVYRHRVNSYKRLLENSNLVLDDDFSLQQFSYNELESATNSFSEEL